MLLKFSIAIRGKWARIVMGMEGFFAAISSPALKHVAAHWNEARADRHIPAWSDIKPASIAAQLPIVWSYKYDAESGDFIGRLAGDEITSVIGTRFHGVRLADILSPADFSWIYPLFRRVVTGPEIYHGDGRVFRHFNRHGSGERIMLPLADDGLNADGILGATEYQPGVLEPHASEGPPWQTVEWFTLD